jgi:hypothetical protein
MISWRVQRQNSLFYSTQLQAFTAETTENYCILEYNVVYSDTQPDLENLLPLRNFGEFLQNYTVLFSKRVHQMFNTLYIYLYTKYISLHSQCKKASPWYLSSIVTFAQKLRIQNKE